MKKTKPIKWQQKLKRIIISVTGYNLQLYFILLLIFHRKVISKLLIYKWIDY